MVMSEKNKVLCGSSIYEQKYYFNEEFNKLPDLVKNELKAMCVLFTEDVGGVLIMEFEEDGTLVFHTEAEESDLLYDEIGCGLKVKQMQEQKRELLAGLELYYRAVFLKQDIS